MMTLFHVQGLVSGENADYFVRAESPREAFELWRLSEEVKTAEDKGKPCEPLFEGDDSEGPIEHVVVWLVPPAIGSAELVAWQSCEHWEGCNSKDFPEIFSS